MVNLPACPFWGLSRALYRWLVLWDNLSPKAGFCGVFNTHLIVLYFNGGCCIPYRSSRDDFHPATQLLFTGFASLLEPFPSRVEACLRYGAEGDGTSHSICE